MNQTIPHELEPLPQGIGKQLKDLEARHQRHQRMLEDHHEAKHERRRRHKAGWHRIKPCPILLR
jgi:hypothetical protein